MMQQIQVREAQRNNPADLKRACRASARAQVEASVQYIARVEGLEAQGYTRAEARRVADGLPAAAPRRRYADGRGVAREAAPSAADHPAHKWVASFAPEAKAAVRKYIEGGCQGRFTLTGISMLPGIRAAVEAGVTARL